MPLYVLECLYFVPNISMFSSDNSYLRKYYFLWVTGMLPMGDGNASYGGKGDIQTTHKKYSDD